MSENDVQNKKGETKFENKTKNKGEWSEIYVFLKVLADKRLYRADKNMKKRSDCYLDVSEVIREQEKGQRYRYIVNGDEVIILCNNELKKIVSVSVFADCAEKVWTRIETDSDNVLTDDDVINSLKLVYLDGKKSPAKVKTTSYGGTNDITMRVKDGRSGSEETLSFSIKSNINSHASLFNASNNTNFLFEITGFDKDEMSDFRKNFSEKGSRPAKAVMGFLSETCHRTYDDFKFKEAANNNAKYNLEITLGREGPAIVGEMLKIVFVKNNGSNGHILDLVSDLAQIDPAGYGYIDRYGNKDITALEDIYTKKITDLVSAAFNGMRFGERWDGKSAISGGYIIVNKNVEEITGEIKGTIYGEIINKGKIKGEIVKNGEIITEITDEITHKNKGDYKGTIKGNYKGEIEGNFDGKIEAQNKTQKSDVLFYPNTSYEFSDYLVKRIKLDTPETKERNECLDITPEDGKYYIKFPLQLRFTNPK